MKMKQKVQNIAGIILSLLLFVGCFVVAFYITLILFTRMGIAPPDLFTQIINSILGLLIALVIIKIALKIDEKKSGFFDSIIKAQKKIAAGDYNIDLDKNTEGLGPYGELVDSVHNMAQELGKLEKMRQEFISNVSHEIQSPLTSIRGFAKALHNDNISAENRLNYLNIIESESMRLSKLSDNLLRLTSLETDSIRPVPKVYRLDKQLRSIILSCEPQWVEKDITMDISMDELDIKADEDMMNQVWINLIHNSIKFTKYGGCININLHEKADRIVFEISDTGMGIAKEDQDHIFERFFKGDRSRTPSVKGSGLGLSIVKRIIDIHHGTIMVDSKLEIGTTFIITLPKGL